MFVYDLEVRTYGNNNADSNNNNNNNIVSAFCSSLNICMLAVIYSKTLLPTYDEVLPRSNPTKVVVVRAERREKFLLPVSPTFIYSYNMITTLQ